MLVLSGWSRQISVFLLKACIEINSSIHMNVINWIDLNKESGRVYIFLLKERHSINLAALIRLRRLCNFRFLILVLST